MKNIKLGKMVKFFTFMTYLTSLVPLFAGTVIDVMTLTKDASGRYTYTFTKENWDDGGSGKVDGKVCTTSFTYDGSEDITLYLDAMCSSWTDGRGLYQGSITQTGTGKINVVWKTNAMRAGAPSVTTNYTGTTTFEGGPSLYLYNGTELGKGQLILNGGNVCSGWNSTGTGNVTPNDIVFNAIELKNNTTFRAGWGNKGYNPPASLTFNGTISGSKPLTFGGESNPGPVTINSENTYTGGTDFSYNISTSANSHEFYTGTPYAMRAALMTVNSNTPFGTGAVTVKNSGEKGSTVATPNLWAFKTTDSAGNAVNRTLANQINVNTYTANEKNYNGHLYLLNDGAVSGATYGTVTLSGKLSGSSGSVLHVLNKGFVLNPAELGNVTVEVSSGDNPFGTAALNVTGKGTYSFQTLTDTKVTPVAHTIAHSEITIQNDQTFTISNADTTSLSVTPTTVSFKNGNSKLVLQNTSAANAITFGSDANRVTLSGGGKLDLSGTTGAKVYLTNNGAARNFSIVGPSTTTNKASVYYKTTSDHQFTGALTGNMDLTVSNTQNVRFNHNYGTGSSFAGNVYLNNQNIYLTYTDELGTATAGTAIYYNLSGNMSNGGNGGVSRPVVNKDLVLQKNAFVRIGWMQYSTEAFTNPCSITFNGTISEQGGSRSLTLGSCGESSSGRFVINGNNTYTGGTFIGTSNNAPNAEAYAYKIRSEYVLGSSTAFSTGTVSAFDSKTNCIPFAIKLNTTDTSKPVTFSNKLDIKNNVVSLNNFSSNTVIYDGEIVGTAGTTLYFGEFDYSKVYTYKEGNSQKVSYDWSSFNKDKGQILFNGTIGTATSKLNVQVNDGVKLGGTGKIFGNVDLLNGSLVTLSTETNEDAPMAVNGTLTIEPGSTLELNVSAEEMSSILSVENLVQKDGATLKLNFTGTLTDENPVPIISSAADLSNLKFTTTGVDAAVVYHAGQLILVTHSAVPEPATWVLLVLGILFCGAMKRRM